MQHTTWRLNCTPTSRVTLPAALPVSTTRLAPDLSEQSNKHSLRREVTRRSKSQRGRRRAALSVHAAQLPPSFPRVRLSECGCNMNCSFGPAGGNCLNVLPACSALITTSGAAQRKPALAACLAAWQADNSLIRNAQEMFPSWLAAARAQVVEGIARRGDVTIPEFHVFAAPRGSEVFRLIFPEGHPAWPGIVLAVTAVAVLAEGAKLALVSCMRPFT